MPKSLSIVDKVLEVDNSQKALRQLAGARREVLRQQIADSGQLDLFLKDLAEMTRLRGEVKKTTATVWGKERTNKYKLLMANLDLSMKHRMQLLNKVLPDDREIVLDKDSGNTMPTLKLTLVDNTTDKGDVGVVKPNNVIQGN